MNSFEKFRALISVINENELSWRELENAGITKEYSNLEMAHLKEVEVDTQKEDSAAFEEYKKEFLNMLK